MPFVVPIGLDFADGVSLLPAQPYNSGGAPSIVGTPLPTAYLSIFDSYGGNTISVEEPPGSPKAERAEQCTCEHRLIMSYAEGINYWDNMPRGTIVTDSAGNVWKVLSCDITRQNATTCEFHYVIESLSFDTPPDNFRISESQLDINIIKHPRYWWALCPYESDDTDGIQIGDTAFVSIAIIKECIIRMIQNYIESPFYPSENQVNSQIQVNIINAIQNGTFQAHYPNEFLDPNQPVANAVFWDGNADTVPDDNCPYYIITIPPSAYTDDDPETGPIHIALAAAQELISKLWRQEDTPYIPGIDLIWEQRFYAPAYLNPGGYIEDPRGWVPSYFLSPAQPAGTAYTGIIARSIQGVADHLLTSNLDTSPEPGLGAEGTIFDFLKQFNPQCYSDDRTIYGNLVFSALRLMDDYEFDRTWFVIRHKWKIAFVGKWDRDLYSGEDGPQVASDFNQNPIDASGI